MKVFCGLEGGASFSKIVLLDENGLILSHIEDEPSTNHLLIGLEECQNRIHLMIRKAKQLAKLDNNLVLDSLGLCLSGCEDFEANQKFKNQMIERFPNLTKSLTIASDTEGSIMTASPKGGIVLIAGTGSNSLLFNPNETYARCGGWGHLLGDYGSAYWITQKAIKAVIEAEENYNPLPFDIKRTKQVILKHFNISDTFGLLEPTYVHFNKTHFSSVCEKLAKIALEENDELCREIFNEAGNDLAKHVIALLPKAQQELLEGEGGLKIVCVGSIFKSWKLLEKGFFSRLKDHLSEVTLLQLTKSSAIGAAFLAVKRARLELKIDFKENSKVLCHYKNGQIL